MCPLPKTLVQTDSWTGREFANSLIDKELQKNRPKRPASRAVFLLMGMQARSVYPNFVIKFRLMIFILDNVCYFYI